MKPAIDPVIKIFPAPPAPRMSRATFCTSSSVPVMLVSTTFRQAAGSWSRKPRPSPRPALASSAATFRPPIAA